MAYIRKHNKLLFVLTLPVYFFIVQQSILNKHTHFYANGMVVTHSHPVDTESDEPIDHHDHSKTEICFYNSIHFDLYKNPEILSVNFRIKTDPVVYHLRNEKYDYFCAHQLLIPRGPPA